MVRYNPDMKYGLTNKEVEERVKNKLLNISEIPKTKTIKQIVLSHIFTLFNILNICLGICICLVESYRNLLFLGVVFCNTIIGIYQEIRAKRIVDKLSLISESKVNVIRNGKKEAINIEDVVLDDITEYKLGNQIVADSIILSGSCEVNESFLTGEADSIVKKRGDYIFSGSYIVRGSVVARVDKIGKDNYISTISSGAKFIKKVDSEIITTINKIIKILSITIIPMGIILFIKQITLPDNDLASSVVNTVAALIGMIPEGLVLLTSSVFAVSIIRLSKYNVLVQELYCIENLARIDTLCLDKTGTITKGVFEVTGIYPANNFDKDTLIRLAAFAESASSHPISVSLKKNYGKEINIDEVSDIQEIAGHGVSALVDGKRVFAGNIKLMKKENISVESEHDEGTVVYVSCNGEYAGCIVISDVVKENSKKAISSLKKSGIDKTVMLTGDSKQAAERVAKSLGLDEYHAELLPADKVEWVEKLLSQKSAKKKLAFVGDGINDAPVLSRADIGIAMGALGSDAAIEAADIVLMDDDPSKIALARKISVHTLKIVKENIVFALAIKAICLVLGALGIANMWVAIFADVGVMILAVLNAIRALKIK